MLDGINNMLKMAGTHVEHISNMIEECEGMAKIEELQNHENIEIYKLAYDIIEQFFSDDVSVCLLVVVVGRSAPNMSDTFNAECWCVFHLYVQADESNIAPPTDESGFTFETPNIPSDGFKF